MNQQQLAKERAERGVCIICGKADDRISRGLCVTHWNRWDKHRKAMPQDQRENYDKRLMEEGYLLPSRQGRPAVADDVFADIAAEFLGLMPVDTESTDRNQLANDLVHQATEEQAAAEPPKKAPKGRAGGGKTVKKKSGG